MKITRKQYLKAVECLPQLRKAEETVAAWQAALDSLGPAVDGLEVIEIEGSREAGFSVKARSKTSGPSTPIGS